MITNNDHPISSLMRFLESQASKYKQLANAPAIERPEMRGRPAHYQIADVEAGTQKAISMIRDGHTIAAAARHIGISRNALGQRLSVRGLTRSKIRREARYED